MTLGVVEYVTDNLAGYPVGLLLTARPAPAAASRLGRELASRGAVARAVLAPLADSQAAEMAAGAWLPSAVCWHRTRRPRSWPAPLACRC